MGCFSDAPRDNPLDINNPQENYSLAGIVHTYYPHPPRSILAEATLLILPLNLLSTSNQEGLYKFENLPPGNYSIICQKEGFLTDTLDIDIPGENSLDFFLDGLPYFKQILLSSHRISHFPPIDDIYYIDLNITTSDTDGVEELDLVWFEVAGLNLSDTLAKTITPGLFNDRITTDIISLHNFIGQEFKLNVQDKFGAIVNSSPHFVSRIIEHIPVLLTPSQGDTVATQPFELSWENVFLPYNFHLGIEIMNINDFGFPTPIDFIDSVPSNASSYLYTSPLDPGTYFWTLYIIDNFGNSSRSKEGAFVISSG
jgi:hypothetical protein